MPPIKRDYVVTGPTPLGQRSVDDYEKFVWTPKRIMIVAGAMIFGAVITYLGVS